MSALRAEHVASGACFGPHVMAGPSTWELFGSHIQRAHAALGAIARLVAAALGPRRAKVDKRIPLLSDVGSSTIITLTASQRTQRTR